MLRSVLVVILFSLTQADPSSVSTAVRELATPESPEVVEIIPDPNGSGKEDFIYRNPSGAITESQKDGPVWRQELKEREEEAKIEREERKFDRRITTPISIFSFVAHLIFAILYKAKVVDMIPPLTQRPISVDEDFQRGVCECCNDRNLCLHTGFCCICRAAHTWHVAGTFEYWPAVIILTLGKSCMCIDTVLYIYMRMKLKDKLGIRRNNVMDIVTPICCPHCAVGQEALAIDAELGTKVACCFDVSTPAAIGGLDSMERGNITQLANPNAADVGVE